MAVAAPKLAPPEIVEVGWRRGIVRDGARPELPLDSAYDLQDWLVDKPGMMYKRGGTAFASSTVGAADSMVLLVGVACPEFPGDPRVVVIGTDGASTRKLYDVTTGTPAAAVALNRQPYENPPTYVDKLILTDGVGNVAPKKAYLSASTVTVADLGGSPPHATYSCVHLGYLVLANNTDNPNRIWFSPIPDIESTWDTTNAYIDCAGPISGLASIQGVLVVFTRSGAQRVLGDIPPGTVGENMQLQPMGKVGCIDARSIVYANGVVYFAHESGIYYTNGAAPAPLTTKPDGTGISSLWRSYTTDLDPVLGAVVASGIYSNDWMFTSIRHPSGPDVQFLCYLPTGTFVRTSVNIACDMYASRAAPHAELYGANAATTEPVRPLQFKGIFLPTSANKNDADGTAVTPVWETGALGLGPGVKQFDFAQVSYDMRDASSDNPTLAATVAAGVEASSYATVQEGAPLIETTDEVRARLMVAKESQTVSLKFTQANASSKTEIYALELQSRPFPLTD